MEKTITKGINYPLAVALEKAGYSILKFECVMENIYDTNRGKAVPTPVVCLKVLPSDDAKMFFIETSESDTVDLYRTET